MKRKKPTSKEVQQVIESLIIGVNNLESRIDNLGFAFLRYIDFKKDAKGYEKFLKERKEKDAKQEVARKNPNRK